MDLIAALHWIHDNVGEFGGDSSNITLVGHDKGASLANLLMISPMARSKYPLSMLTWDEDAVSCSFLCLINNWTTERNVHQANMMMIHLQVGSK